MYVLADIKRNCRKSRFIQEQRQPLKKNLKQKIVIFKYVSKMYIFEDIK